ncbi:MAG: hypothetical protein WCH40_13140, partial [Verrucomicrobiales bacterium]
MSEEIFKFTPRVSGAEYNGGADPTLSLVVRDYSSKAGSVRAGAGQANDDETTRNVTPDADRLYATIDEFLYNPNFTAATSTRNLWKLAPDVAQRDTTREMLEMARFFLTANSKAPEQNLYNLPRVAVWPEQVLDTKRTAFDKLIAFCSTVGPKTGNNTLPFYFTRKNGYSSGLTKTGTIDPAGDLSPRNLALTEYLKGLTSRTAPGWKPLGGAATTFAAKYGVDKNQILTEIFDYIRCVNLADNSDPAVASSYTQLTDSGGKLFLPDATHTSRGQVTPIEIPDATQADGYTRGIGRIMSISELALIVNRKLDSELPAADQPTKAKVQIALLPKFFTPMAGFAAMGNSVRVTFDPIDITVKDKSGNYNKNPFKDFTGSAFKNQPSLFDIGHIHDTDSWASAFGGSIGWASLCTWKGTLLSAPPTGEMILEKMLVNNLETNTLEIEGTCTATITLPKANLTEAQAKLLILNDGSEAVVQVIKFRFPKFTVNLPPYWNRDPGRTDNPGFAHWYIVDGGTGSNVVGSRYVNGTEHYLTTDRDAVRSLVATGNGVQADTRIIAASKLVEDTYFKPTNITAYNDSTLLNNGGKNTPTKATHSM